VTNEPEVHDARTTPIPDTDGHGDHPGARGQTIQLKDIQKTLPLRVLSEADWQHWITKGFVVIRFHRNNATPWPICSGNFRKWIRLTL
jgi:hypothetical protein